MHDVNIVIVNYKMKDHIEKCLASLFLDLSDASFVFSIVIVDNNSGDHIEGMLKDKFPTVKYIPLNDNFGFGRAQNIGIKSNSARYHFVLNPDTLFNENEKTVKKLIEFMDANPKVGIAGPKIIYLDDSLQYSCCRFPVFWQPIYSRTFLGKIGWGKKVADHYFMKDFDHNESMPVDWLVGAALIVRHEATEQVGLFDERFWMYAEDSDWCRRMWENGWLVYYIHHASVRHVHTRSSAKVPSAIKALFVNKLAREHIYSWLKYMWKWRGNHRYYA